MMKNIETLLKKLPVALLCGVLALSLFPPKAEAVKNQKYRYGCIANIKGRLFTNGAIRLKGYPCRVAPAEVRRLIKAREADKKTDQINFDYFWNQEYYTHGKLLTDIRNTGEGAVSGGRSIPFALLQYYYPAVNQKDNSEVSRALVGTKTALGFEIDPNATGYCRMNLLYPGPVQQDTLPECAYEQSAGNKIPLYTSAAAATDDIQPPENQAPKKPEAAPISDETDSNRDGVPGGSVENSR